MDETTTVNEDELSQEEHQRFQTAWKATGEEAVVGWRGKRWLVDYRPLERLYTLTATSD